MLQTCIEGLQRCRPMLWEQPALLLSTMSKEKPAITSSSISDSMHKPGATSTSASTTAAAAAAAAAATAAATALSSSSLQRPGSSSSGPHGPVHAAKQSQPGSGTTAAANLEAEGGGVLSRFESFRRRITTKTGSMPGTGPPPPSEGSMGGAQAAVGGAQAMPPVVHISGLGGLKYNAPPPGGAPGLSSGGIIEHTRTVSATGNFFSDDEADDE